MRDCSFCLVSWNQAISKHMLFSVSLCLCERFIFYPNSIVVICVQCCALSGFFLTEAQRHRDVSFINVIVFVRVPIDIASTRVQDVLSQQHCWLIRPFLFPKWSSCICLNKLHFPWPAVILNTRHTGDGHSVLQFGFNYMDLMQSVHLHHGTSHAPMAFGDKNL